MTQIVFPPAAKDRGLAFWLRPRNLWAARRTFRLDYSNEWRYAFGAPVPPDRSVPFGTLLDRPPDAGGSIRFLILGDTGEGDQSQYGTVPLIRSLRPDFLIINGDIVYPAGRINETQRDDDDFLCGFFEPYRDLGCPIWAVPGNHEYYSDHDGRDCYEVFCTRRWAKRWDDYGLRLVPQPGTYWELKDPKRPGDLAVIGLDSGKTANLDGKNSWWQIWKRHVGADETQHAWLIDRLEKAQAEDRKVIVLFHIPALVRQKHEKKTHLERVHRILAQYPCVKLVIGAHDHNFQDYPADVFGRYLTREQGAASTSSSPRYYVCGRGGAAMSSTVFGDQDYPCEPYPTAEQYRVYLRAARRRVEESGWIKRALAGFSGNLRGRMAQWGLAKTMLGHLAAQMNEALADDDAAQYLSWLLVEVTRHPGAPPEIKVTPIFLDDLKQLYDHLPADAVADVTAKTLLPQRQVDRCQRPPLYL